MGSKNFSFKHLFPKLSFTERVKSITVFRAPWSKLVLHVHFNLEITSGRQSLSCPNKYVMKLEFNRYS